MPSTQPDVRLLRLESWSKPLCAGGIPDFPPIGVLPFPITCRTTRSLTKDTQLQFSYVVDLGDAVFPPSQTIRQYRTDKSVREWDIIRSQTRLTEEGAVITITCSSMLRWLAKPGYIRSLSAGGRPNYAFSPTRATAQNIWDQYIAPTLLDYGLPWIASGTFEPTELLAFDFERLTPIELLGEMATRTNCEFEMVPDGDTGYLVNLVKQIGASAPVSDIRFGVNMQSTEALLSVADWAHVIQARGETAADGLVATPGRAVYRITSLDSANTAVTLEDPETGLPVISVQGYLGGGYLICRETRRVYQSLGSYPASSSVYPNKVLLDSLSGLTVGFTLEHRRTIGTDVLYTESAVPLFITAIDTVNKKLTLEERSLAGDPITSTNVNNFPGNSVDRLTLAGTYTVSSFNSTTSEYTLTSVTGIAVGQIAIPITSTSPPTGSFPALRITAVDNANNRVTVVRFMVYGSPPYTAGGGTSLRVYNRLSVGVHALAADASANTITVDSVTPFTSGDGVLLYRWINGELPDDTELYIGAEYRRFKTASLADAHREVNLLGNGFVRTFPNPSQLPTWWGVTLTPGGDFKVSNCRNSAAPYVEDTGPYTLRFKLKGRVGITAAITAGDNFFLAASVGAAFEAGDTVIVDPSGTAETKVVSAVTDLGGSSYRYTIVGTFANNHAISVLALEPGASGGTTATLQLAFTPLLSADDTAITASVRAYAKGFTSWTLNFNGTTATATVQDQFDQLNVIAKPASTPAFPITLIISAPIASTDYNKALYLSAIGVYPTGYVPVVLPDWSNGNRLAAYAASLLAARGFLAPAEITVKVLDLARLDPDYRHLAFTLGGLVRTTFPGWGGAYQVRVLELDENDLDPLDTNITLATSFASFTQQV